MVTTIVAAANECGAIHTSHYKCGMAVGGLTSASSGLAAATAGMLTECHTSLHQEHSEDGLDETTHLGDCVINAKETMTSLFEASHKLASVSHAADEDEASLNVVAAFADL